MSPDIDIINKIVSLEWRMFRDVNKGKMRAECQEDYDTFLGMRRAQYLAWSDNAVELYLDDLNEAVSAGRNLVTEKYIHMMNISEPSKHDALLDTIVRADESVTALAHKILEKILEQTRELHNTYPIISCAGRPLYSKSDRFGFISVETYQLGELLTYSKNTLATLYDHIIDMENRGVSLSREILKNTVVFFGYESLDDAEAQQRRRLVR